MKGDVSEPEASKLLEEAEEVRIETCGGEAVAEHRTVVWVVGVDGAIFVRFVHGERGPWYRGAPPDPEVTLCAGGRCLPGRAAPETSDTFVGVVSEAHSEKYEVFVPGPTQATVSAEDLPMTFRLLPT